MRHAPGGRASASVGPAADASHPRPPSVAAADAATDVIRGGKRFYRACLYRGVTRKRGEEQGAWLALGPVGHSIRNGPWAESNSAPPMR